MWIEPRAHSDPFSFFISYYLYTWMLFRKDTKWRGWWWRAEQKEKEKEKMEWSQSVSSASIPTSSHQKCALRYDARVLCVLCVWVSVHYIVVNHRHCRRLTSPINKLIYEFGIWHVLVRSRTTITTAAIAPHTKREKTTHYNGTRRCTVLQCVYVYVSSLNGFAAHKSEENGLHDFHRTSAALPRMMSFVFIEKMAWHRHRI